MIGRREFITLRGGVMAWPTRGARAAGCDTGDWISQELVA